MSIPVAVQDLSSVLAWLRCTTEGLLTKSAAFWIMPFFPIQMDRARRAEIRLAMVEAERPRSSHDFASARTCRCCKLCGDSSVKPRPRSSRMARTSRSRRLSEVSWETILFWRIASRPLARISSMSSV